MTKLFKYLKSFKKQIALIVLFVFVQIMAQLYLPTLMSDIVDKGVVEKDMEYIWKIGGLMLIVALLGSVATILASYYSSKTSVGFAKILRGNIFKKVERFSLNEFDSIGTSSLITRTTNDVTQLQNVILMFLRMMLTAPIMMVGGLIMAISKDPKLSMINLIVLPVLGLVVVLISKKAMPLFKVMQKKLDKLNLVMREALTGIRVIRAFNKTEHEQKRFHDANEDITETAISVNKIIVGLFPILMFVMNMTTVFIIWFGAKRIEVSAMGVGDLMAFIQYMMQIMWSLLSGAIIFILIPRAQASATRINEVLDIEPEIKQKDITDKLSENKRKSMEFKNVTFRYKNAPEPVLNNISFSSNAGEIVSIIGGTGSGKSTILKLIERFYDIEEGEILFDGIDIRNLDIKELRDRIGIVSQKVVLFSGTIAENIRFGKRDATKEEIKKAAQIAQAEEFIEKLDDKYDHYISQGGKNLSGGQKQRISIARAIVRKPDIYIFDDSFSALDFKTGAKLKKSLREETADSTALIVAQRVTSVMDSDKIIVLDEGEIAGIGTHKELLESCKVYKEIVKSQLSKEEY